MRTNELNSVIRTDLNANPRLKKGTVVSEVFNAWTIKNGDFSGMDMGSVEKSKEYIMNLGKRAGAGDYNAISEMNTLRTIAVDAIITPVIGNLGIYGEYENLAFDESVERKVVKRAGESSRIQAPNSDVPFAAVAIERYPVATRTISGGYVVDYRRVELGDMSLESKGIKAVAADILNKAHAVIMTEMYNSIKNARGIVYSAEFAGVTKAGVDEVLNKVRRFGPATIMGSYALLSQFSNFMGYRGQIDDTVITGVSRTVMDDIYMMGRPAMYNGAALQELPSAVDVTRLNAEGDDFASVLPEGLGFVLPKGQQAPVWVATRGGVTSLQGANVKTGLIETRFDLEIAVDVAKGLEYQIGMIHDTNLDDLAA